MCMCVYANTYGVCTCVVVYMCTLRVCVYVYVCVHMYVEGSALVDKSSKQQDLCIHRHPGCMITDLL